MLVDDANIRIVVADDHPVVRQGLKALFSAHGDIEIVADVRNIEGLLAAMGSLDPDVVVLDLDLDPENDDDMAALQALRDHSPHARVVAYTAHENEDRVVQALALGVEGYILKSANPEELLKAIRVVYRGGLMLQSSVASTLMRHMRSGATIEQPNKGEAPVSRRELDVLRLMGQGKSNRQIADKLAISERTVKFHVSSILSKLDVKNRTAAVLKATQDGILSNSVQ